MGAGKRILLTGIFLALAEYCLSQDIKVEMGVGTVYDVSQKRAEKALARLSKTAKKEDAWIYYNGQLIDNGKNEYSGTVMMHFPILIRTGNVITDTVHIPPGSTAWNYHNHTYDSPPSIRDIVNQSLLMDSVFTNEYIIPRVANKGRIWEFDLEQSLREELHGKSLEERFKILEKKVNIAYTPENRIMFGGKYPYPYEYNPKTDKRYKEYISIMRQVGVNARFGKPGRFR